MLHQVQSMSTYACCSDITVMMVDAECSCLLLDKFPVFPQSDYNPNSCSDIVLDTISNAILARDYSLNSLSRSINARLGVSEVSVRVKRAPALCSMSRAKRAATQKDTASKFAELRALKQSGKKRIDSYRDNVEDDIYEEVDEDGYKQVVRDRLDKDDFVVDDNGLGYADNGMDEWELHQDESDDGADRRRKPSKSKKTQGTTEALPDAGAMKKFLTKAAVIPAPKTV